MTNSVLSNPSARQIDICVCTFRRPHIAKTLQSIAQLVLMPDWDVRVIVADNDETPSAKNLIDEAAREYKLPLTYIHAPARNISVARNACLDAAQAPLIAFIDDDEIATPAWLRALVTELDKNYADVVLGKVEAVYGSSSSKWMRQGDFHAPKPIWVDGIIKTGYTCNVLFKRSAPSIEGLRFREEFGQSGGEDTVFFTSVFKAGGRFSYAPAAIVTEEVTTERASFTWLLKRAFRSGQTHGVLLLDEMGGGFKARSRNILITAAKAFFCFSGALLNLGRSVRSRYWILRGTLHMGAISRLLGKRELALYR